MLENSKVYQSSYRNNLENIMDNQQKTDVAFAAYLAAMLDGEGCVQLVPYNQKSRNRGLQYQAHVRIDNCDHRILTNIKQALAHFGVAFHVYESSSTRGSNSLTVKIQRLSQLQVFLELMLTQPLLGKRKQCDLFLEFVISRLGPNGKPLGVWNPYNERTAQ